MERSQTKSVGVRMALAALRAYKVYISFWFAGSCRFEPTCSRYAYEAIERFGVLRGSWLGLKRLSRCQPLSPKFGYDPVPEDLKTTRAQHEAHAKCNDQAEVAQEEVHS